ncbi:cobalamin biosynthesis protein CbiX [Paenibacillus sp. 1011MAR3C5]|uniref:sirohydrochlorin chelatase n=1 Tax=Paenibacillus sp. 1011MAR3C5 TaxID=1675787 RepID=UPI000E6CE9ED|nr:CbiX/SirB N-terminal domain-containing protein [Paenibacillus sp. 1011MAR3C5]RJE88702.1 cobalamin biosynthesis protein CbiX [Paenibacillus sp. 1011MAR3C5]
MNPGILVVSHGSREESWVNLIDEAVRQASGSIHVPVVSAFLEIVGGRLIQDGIDELERQGVTDMFVLPLFVSSGSTHVDEIGQAFGLTPLTDFEGDLGLFRVEANVHYGSPIDDDEDIAEMLYAHISNLSTCPDREAVLLIGHGNKEPVFHERWQAGLSGLAERVRRRGGFGGADYAMLLPDQAAGKLEALQGQDDVDDVLVVPVFLSQGYFTNKVIPARLEGLAYRYNGRAMLPHPAIKRWLHGQMAGWLSRYGYC